MKVALLAYSIFGAMGQYLNSLEKPLSNYVDLHYFVPSHYNNISDKVTLHTFKTGLKKSRVLMRYLNPISFYEIWREIRLLSPDILHIFNGEGYPWTPIIVHLAKKAGIPVVVTLHDPDPHPGNKWELINAYLRKYTLIYSDIVHIHSAIFIDLIEKKYNIDKRYIRIIPHGSFAHLFTKYRKQMQKKQTNVLFFGRIEKYKGIKILVEAAKYLPKDYKIIIAGPGRLSDDLREKISGNPNMFKVINKYLSNEDVAKLFMNCSVCVLPYIQATQSSIPLIAAAFNVPVVASAVGALTEDVTLVKGLLVPPGDPQKLAEAIIQSSHIMPYYPKDREFDIICKKFYYMYKDLV